MSRRKKLSLFAAMLVGGAVYSPTFLLRDVFTTNEFAPLVSPRTCEPGPGILTITDVDNRLSIASNILVVANAAEVATALSATITRKTGLGLFFSVSHPTAANFFKMSLSSAGAARDMIKFLNAVTQLEYDAGIGVSTIDAGVSTTPVRFGIITRPSGHVFLKNISGSVYQVVYVTNVLQDNCAVYLYALGSTTGKYYNVCIYDTIPEFSSDYVSATARVAVPGDGETIVSQANAFVEFGLVAQAGVTQSIWFRRLTDDETWRIDCDQVGGTIKLYSRTGGVDTEVDAGKTQTWVAGNSYRVCIQFYGTSIRTFVNNAGKHVATSSFNQTATGIKASHAGSNLVAWPGDLTLSAIY
jgi:hypothetical protein